MIIRHRLWIASAAALVAAVLIAVALPSASQASDTDITVAVTAAPSGTVSQWASVGQEAIDPSLGGAVDALGVMRLALADVEAGATVVGASALACGASACLPTGTDTLLSAASAVTGDVLAVVDGADGAPRAMVTLQGSRLALVAINDSQQAHDVTLDLSAFASLSRHASLGLVQASDAGFVSTTSSIAVASGVTFALPANTMAVLSMSASSEAYEGIERVVLSDYATGKAMVLGEAGTVDALRIQTLGANADAVAPQVLTFYAVEGAANTYVIANAQGVLALSNLPAPQDRLALSVDLTIEEAMADTYAQWRVIDNGNGTVSFHNVHGYTWAGAAPAELNLYNWRTADGSAIHTWNDTQDAVARWRMYDTSATVTPVNGVVTDHQLPQLPATVPVSFGWGATEAVAVTWTVPSDAQWDVDGTVTVTGVGTTMFGEQLSFQADYITVAEVGDAVTANLTVYAGIPLSELRKIAPSAVDRTLSGTHVTLSSPVTWDWDAISEEDLAQSGKVVSVPAVAELGFQASLEITVVEPSISSLWNTPAVPVARRLGSSAAISYDNVKLYDGNVNSSAGGDWQSGGIRLSPATLTWTFSDSAVISRVGLSGFSSATPAQHPIGDVTFEYLDVTGAWVPIPSEQSTVTVNAGSSTGMRAQVSVEFAPVVAYGYRVTYTNTWAVDSGNGASWVQLSEVVLAGPATPTK